MINKDQIEQLKFSKLRNLIRRSGENAISDDEDSLIEIAQFHNNNAIRRSAITALRKLGSKKAYPIFISILATDFNNQNLRESAIKALGETGNDETKIILKQLAETEDISRFGRQAAQNALGRLYLTLARRNETSTHSVFISYSSNDEQFARRLYTDLQKKGVHCWFAPEELIIGVKFRQQIENSIHTHDKLLVVLSESSISSTWVETEVEAAMERERKEHRSILFPISIDDAVLSSNCSWAASLRRERHIGDFKAWKDKDAYQKSFVRLLRDLKIT